MSNTKEPYIIHNNQLYKLVEDTDENTIKLKRDLIKKANEQFMVKAYKIVKEYIDAGYIDKDTLEIKNVEYLYPPSANKIKELIELYKKVDAIKKKQNPTKRVKTVYMNKK